MIYFIEISEDGKETSFKINNNLKPLEGNEKEIRQLVGFVNTTPDFLIKNFFLTQKLKENIKNDENLKESLISVD